MKSTNYYDTFIEVAEDCPVEAAEAPAQCGEGKSVPQLQYEMIFKHPYQYTQDDVLFAVHAERNGIRKNDAQEREKFFWKGQPCLRCSSLGKRYGWGIHSDSNGKVALYPVESKEYKKLASDKKLKRVKEMRTKK
ncbi:hypothetical protein ETAA8_04550 [Anatilimnocola aggregata]|uniref:Uncharacterized protein n=1 Tax=Anatilimnocola aggregata TaxID=2528021 RepID=A0A517Y571_9BACT|nr:DUF6157 family protein [Anatilimnocola aggregata]QDU25387.1 hypothetical protein ETAA8_04550 [Anatilimnocola aggregata]